MRKFLFFFFISQFSLYGQVSKIDSFDLILKQNRISDTIWISSNIQYLNQFEKLPPPKFENLCNTLINYSKKLDFFNGQLKGLRILAYYYADHGNYEKALETAFERLKFCEKFNNLYEIIDTYNILVFIYARSENLNKAIEYANIAKNNLLSLPKSHSKRYILLGNIYSGLGNLYVLTKQNDKAIGLYSDVLDHINYALKNNLIDTIMGNTLIGTAFTNLSFIYYKNKEYSKSAFYAEKALSFSENHATNISKNSILNILIVSYSNIQKYKEAENYLNIVKSIINNQQNTIDDITGYYEAGKELYLKQENYEQAFYFQKRLTSIKDSLQDINVKNNINELSIKYETEKKENENKYLNNINIAISKQNKYVIFFSIILLILLLINIFQYRKLYHSKKLLSHSNYQLNITNNKKDTLFKIISHDLKTPANGFVQLVNLMILNIKNHEFDQLLDISHNAQKLANDLQLNVNNLLFWSMSNQGIINRRFESVYLIDSFLELEEIFGSYAELKNINIKFIGNRDLVIDANRVHINTILKNLLSNALKFTPIGGDIFVSCKEIENYIQIEIEDSGSGFNQNQINKFENGLNLFESNDLLNSTGTGLGLEICKELTNLYNGKIKIMKSKLLNGALVQLTFNKK